MIQRLKLLCAPPLWRAYCATVRWPRLSADEAAEAVIYACLHRDILPSIRYVEPSCPALLVSPSPDGDILVRTLGLTDYRFVRGGTGEKGDLAFRGLLRHLRDGHSVGVAVDGPKGPFGEIHEGVLHLARLSGAPLRPLRAVAHKPAVLKTWDRTVVPRPFAALDITPGPRLTVAKDADAVDLARVKGQLDTFFSQEGHPHESA